MSETDSNIDDKKPKGVFNSLVSEGHWLYTKGEYKKAIDIYTTALTHKPDHKGCFVSRSKCYLKLGQTGNALKDAEASLIEDPSYFLGLYQKAEVLYHMGEFEFALVFYHRGQKLRPQIQEFRLGIQKAEEAIFNAVGSPSSVKLEVKGEQLVLQSEEEVNSGCVLQQNLETTRTQPMADIQHPTTSKSQTQKISKSGPICVDSQTTRTQPMADIQHPTTSKSQTQKISKSGPICVDSQTRTQPIADIQHPTTSKSQTQKISKRERANKQRYGEFYNDWIFLHQLLKDEELVKGRTKEGEILGDLIREGIASLDRSSEWNQEQPINDQEKDEQRSSGSSHSPPSEPECQ